MSSNKNREEQQSFYNWYIIRKICKIFPSWQVRNLSWHFYKIFFIRGIQLPKILFLGVGFNSCSPTVFMYSSFFFWLYWSWYNSYTAARNDNFAALYTNLQKKGLNLVNMMNKIKVWNDDDASDKACDSCTYVFHLPRRFIQF